MIILRSDHMLNPENPAELVTFEDMMEDDRATFISRLRGQFTLNAAIQLQSEGMASEAHGLAPPPINPNHNEGYRIEFTQAAHADWRFLAEVVHPRYTDVLGSGLALLQSSAFSRDSCVELRRNGFLLRQDELRWIFRYDHPNHRAVVHTIARRAHNPQRKIWRYFDQRKSLDLIRSGQLYLSRVDTLSDRFEATPTAAMIEQHRKALIASLGAAHPDHLRAYSNVRRGTYVCCWHKTEHEAVQMWRSYCRAKPSADAPEIPGGFALQTTERRLQHEFLRLRDATTAPGVKLFLRDVEYVDHAADSGPGSFGDHAFLKAKWFSDEKEVRLAVQRLDCIAAGSAAEIEGRLAALPRFERIAIDLDAIAVRLALNPDASVADRDKIVAAVAELRPALRARVGPSEIEVQPIDALPNKDDER